MLCPNPPYSEKIKSFTKSRDHYLPSLSSLCRWQLYGRLSLRELWKFMCPAYIHFVHLPDYRPTAVLLLLHQLPASAHSICSQKPFEKNMIQAGKITAQLEPLARCVSLFRSAPWCPLGTHQLLLGLEHGTESYTLFGNVVILAVVKCRSFHEGIL